MNYVNSRAKGKSAEDCQELRSTLDCLDLTCRMGCEYGFELDEETRCPKCHCKDPCSAVKCSDMEQCQLVEVSCKDYYCPPVPACKLLIELLVPLELLYFLILRFAKKDWTMSIFSTSQFNIL